SDLPARRTGHVCVTHNDKIYMFGGTDGQYHYNDTWCFDVPSRTWRELTCIGFIPVPREGHAAALVDDVMYVFGGRGVDGKDLSDLAAFKISNSRWYMFQNMGPSPSGRSGHAMAAAGSRVFVLGGESFTTEKPDDPSLIHVLDSRHIKYPDSNRAPPANAPGPASAGRRPSVGAGSAAAAAAREQQQQQAAQQPVPAPTNVSSPPTQTSALQKDTTTARDRAMSPPARDRALSPTAASVTSRTGAMSPQERVIQQQSGRSGSPSTGPGSGTPPLTQRAVSPINKTAANGGVSFPLGVGASALANGNANPAPAPAPSAPSPQMNGPAKGKPPPRPKRGDEDMLYGSAGMEKDRSEDGSIEPPIRERAMSPPSSSTPTLNPTRAISPPNGIVRTGRDSPSVAARVNGLAARSPSPSSGPPPPDAFYSSGSGMKSPTGINGRTSANVGADLLRAKEAEIEGLRRRETWMKAALARAAKSGFVWADGDLQESRVGTWMHDDEAAASESVHGTGEEEGSGRQGMANTVMKLKQEQAKLQAAFASQAKSISDRLAESDRVRNAAVQEAAFYRAKLAAYENGSAGDVNRLERDRVNSLETQLQSLTAERNATERKLEEANDSHLLQSRLREQAEERAIEAVKRAESAEEAHEVVKREHSELREKHLTVESNLRDHADRLLTVTSSTSQLDAERSALRSQVGELLATREQQQRALDQARSALDAAGARASEMDAQWEAARNRIDDLERDLSQSRNELEARVQEADSMAARLADVENAFAKSREEADEYRASLTGSIGKLLDTQRELQADEDRAS
ncbi:Negative regulator of mitotic exit, partial [Tulasnella sp. 427]